MSQDPSVLQTWSTKMYVALVKLLMSLPSDGDKDFYSCELNMLLGVHYCHVNTKILLYVSSQYSNYHYNYQSDNQVTEWLFKKSVPGYKKCIILCQELLWITFQNQFTNTHVISFSSLALGPDEPYITSLIFREAIFWAQKNGIGSSTLYTKGGVTTLHMWVTRTQDD